MSPAFWLVCLVVASPVAGVVLRARSWNMGASGGRARLRLAAVAPRYLRDVHDVVAREPLSAWMHTCVAGGGLAAALLVALAHGPIQSPLLATLALVALLVCGIGVGMLIVRRRRLRERLSGGAWERLPWTLAAFVVFCSVSTLPLVGVGAPMTWATPGMALLLALGCAAAADLAIAFAAGPLKHAATGALHLAAHPRAERFGLAARGGASPVALAPLDLDVPRLGIEKARDFAWNRILSFDACVECGRCEQACPAFAAGAPLNPKALIQSLARTASGPWMQPYRGNGHPGLASSQTWAVEEPIVGPASAVTPETLWACTTCRACVHECPMLIEHVDAVVDLRRFQTLEVGEIPGTAPTTLRNLRRAGHTDARAPEERLAWMNDLRIRVLGPDESCDVLLWMGSGMHEPRGQATLRSLARLLRKAGVDFAVLGADERDCGDIARRLGDEDTFQRLARENLDVLAARRFREIVTPDPHAYNCLKNEYPAFGGRHVVRHHSEVLLDLLRERRIQPRARAGAAATYHDPCYLARYNGVVRAPREILGMLGMPIVEMERSAERTRCCGGGGGAPLTSIPSKRRMADVRMDDARAVTARVLAVACPGCMSMLDAVTAPRPQVRDIAELVWEAVEA